jgi:hypothetical protein
VVIFSDPCERQGACGSNSLCRVVQSSAQCYCPDDFQGNPTPQQGCVRTPITCKSAKECPLGHICQSNQCRPACLNSADCAVGERCENGMCMKTCYNDNNCLQGSVCVEGMCQSGCRVASDCRQNEVCISNQCRCSPGFVFGPNGCDDIDECLNKPCHASASCVNLAGSYKCLCPEGTVGDPVDKGCKHFKNTNYNNSSTQFRWITNQTLLVLISRFCTSRMHVRRKLCSQPCMPD